MLQVWNRTRLITVALVVGVLVALGGGSAAWADSASDMTDVGNALNSALSTFIDAYSDAEATDAEAAAAAAAFESAASTGQSDFARIADETDDSDLADHAETFASLAGDMSTAAGSLAAALTNGDATALSQGEDAMNTAIDAYNKAIDDYNDFLDTRPASPISDPTFVMWLVVLIIAVAYLVLTLLFALLTRKQEGLLAPKADKKGNIQQHSLRRLRWRVVLWAGVFVVGAAIPFFQVLGAELSTSGDFTYRIFWYPLAAGAVLSIVGLVQYFTAAAQVRREGSAQPYASVLPAPPEDITQPAPALPASPAAPAPAPAPAPSAPVPAAVGTPLEPDGSGSR